MKKLNSVQKAMKREQQINRYIIIGFSLIGLFAIYVSNTF